MLRVASLVFGCAAAAWLGWTAPAGAQIFAPSAALNSNAATDAGDDVSPNLATDGAGTWITAWTSFDSLGGAIGTDGDILFARSLDAGATWTAPTPLNTNAATDAGEDGRPQIATDGAGAWVAVWDSDDALGGTIGTDGDILVARSTDGGATWTAPQALNTNAGVDSGRDSDPVIVSDGTGTWVAAWRSTDSLGGTIGTEGDILFARSLDGGTTWTAPAALNTNATADSTSDFAVRLAAAGSGNWVALWTAGSTLVSARSMDDGVTWTSPAPFIVQGTSLQLARDGVGTLLALTESVFPVPGSDTEILAARSTDGGATWSGPIPITNNNVLDGTPFAAADRAGNWLAVWIARDPLHVDFDIQIARSADGGLTWTPPTTLDPGASTDTRTDFAPRIATDQAGAWVAVWDASDFGGSTLDDFDVRTARGTICGDALRVAPEACDDGNTLDWDCCSATCQPQTGCRAPTQPGKARLLLKDRSDDALDYLAWRWLKGDLTTAGDFGDPATTDSYSLCFYDESAATTTLLFRATLPTATLCAGQSCWEPLAPGLLDYRNDLATPEGIDRVKLHAGPAGRARIVLRGTGVNLSNRSELNLPAPPLPLPLRVQLQATTGRCWEATYSATGTRRNAAGQFKAKAD